MRGIVIGKERLDKETEDIFGDVRYVDADRDTEIKDLEENMDREGIRPFDQDDFLLYPRENEDIGLPVSRNRYNSGMLVENRGEANLIMGKSPVLLRRALKLPHEKPSRVMIVAPHFEEDFGMIMSYLHKHSGDNVYLVFVTEINERIGSLEKSHEIYRDVVGLKDGEYAFLGFEDTRAHVDTERLSRGIEWEFEKFSPDTVIVPSRGGNRDHMVVNRVCENVLKDKANIIYGQSVQSVDFIPRLFSIIDADIGDSLLEDLYSSGEFGPDSYMETVGDLLRTKPEPVSRQLAGSFVMDLSCYGTEPLFMDHRYRIPHRTCFFEKCQNSNI